MSKTTARFLTESATVAALQRIDADKQATQTARSETETLRDETLTLRDEVAAIIEYRHVQSQPLAVWTVEHGLNRRPAVTVVDSTGSVVEGVVRYIDNNQVRIEFSSAFSGEAYLN